MKTNRETLVALVEDFLQELYDLGEIETINKLFKVGDGEPDLTTYTNEELLKIYKLRGAGEEGKK